MESYELGVVLEESAWKPSRLRSAVEYAVRLGDDIVLTCPRFRARDRRGELPLGGALGAGSVLYRTRRLRFELRTAGGSTHIVGRWGRPTRALRPTWDVTTRSGDSFRMIQRASWSSIRIARAQLAGEPLGSYTTDAGFELILLGHATAHVRLAPEDFDGATDEALVASIVAWRMNPTPDLDP